MDTMDTGLLVIRLVVGSLMAAHGAQKLFGWFGGHGLAGVAGYFESLGFRPGRPFAAAAGVAEFGGGLLLALGFLGPIGPAAIVSVMIVAAVSAHWGNGLFAMSNGVEVPLLYGAVAVALALTGPGALSLDALFGLTPLFAAPVNWTVLALGVLGGIGNLLVRRTELEAVAA
jgi:putative oxidoreductase